MAANLQLGEADHAGGRELGLLDELFPLQVAVLQRDLADLEPDPARQDRETQTILADLVAFSRELAGVERFTGRAAPSVIT